jgi:hypothetical protein
MTWTAEEKLGQLFRGKTRSHYIDMSKPTCSLCYERWNDTTKRKIKLQCRHILCLSCYERWKSQGTCPFCRKELVVDNPEDLPQLALPSQFIYPFRENVVLLEANPPNHMYNAFSIEVSIGQLKTTSISTIQERNARNTAIVERIRDKFNGVGYEINSNVFDHPLCTTYFFQIPLDSNYNELTNEFKAFKDYGYTVMYKEPGRWRDHHEMDL